MKTPREIILERHQSAEAKLKAIRAEELAACARSAAAETRFEPQATLSLGAIAGQIWQEMFWPWRRVWAGVVAAWVIILGLGIAAGDTPRRASARPPRPNPEVLAVLHQQEQLLSQLLGTERPPRIAHPRAPGPRSGAEPLPGNPREASRQEIALCENPVAAAWITTI